MMEVDVLGLALCVPGGLVFIVLWWSVPAPRWLLALLYAAGWGWSLAVASLLVVDHALPWQDALSGVGFGYLIGASLALGVLHSQAQVDIGNRLAAGQEYLGGRSLDSWSSWVGWPDTLRKYRRLMADDPIDEVRERARAGEDVSGRPADQGPPAW